MFKRNSQIFFIISLFFGANSFAEESDHSQFPDIRLAFEILDIMKENVITKENVDWLALHSDVQKIYDSGVKKPFYESVYKIFEKADTGHSFYSSLSNPKFIMHRKKSCKNSVFEFTQPPNGIGYIKISRFSNRHPLKKLEFVEDIRKQIKKHNNDDLKGWVVDLSDNSGGNMWPMLAGIAPLLNDGIHGYFDYPDGKKYSWSTQDGKSFTNGNFSIGFEENLELNNTLPIAVISGGTTSSSGEALLITFKGKSNTRFFGHNSCGMSTANKTFKLSNGALLAVTTSTMMDSKFTSYGNEVKVDIETNSPYVEAVKWIELQSLSNL